MSTTMLSNAEGVGVATMRRASALGGADQLRLLGSALGLFLFIDFLRLTVTSPVPIGDGALVAVMDATAYVAVLVAIWRPRLGLGIAGIPLATALVYTSTGMDAVLIAAVLALGLAQLGRRPALVTSGVFVAYAVARVLSYSGDARPMLAGMLAVSVLVGLVVGWTALLLRERRERDERTAMALATENARIRADERRTLSRELHDVVAHQLSTASLQIMGARESHDPVALRRVLGTVDRATAEALTELRLLVRVLRDDPSTAASGTEIRELAERVPPTQAAADAQLTLIRAGFEPDVRVPAAADDLEMTVQRTLSRVIKEATANIVQHAPRQSRCVIHTAISDQQVTLQVRNLVPAGFTQPELGWGLRGLRERIELTGGKFTVGVLGNEWVVSATLPHG